MEWLVAVVAGLVVGAVNVIGGAVLIRRLTQQISALKGTVEAQQEQIKTIAEVNRVAVEVFKAMDPERWAREVKVHKELADRKAEAMVEEARREFERDKAATGERAVQAMKQVWELYEGALAVGMKLVPYVPQNIRLGAILTSSGPDHVKDAYLDVAQKAPDWSRAAVTLETLVVESPPTPTSPLAPLLIPVVSPPPPAPPPTLQSAPDDT